ncbi:MAG: XcyI family restriction endonuclease [Bacteroidales bacterium]|nr:XcyI family restriction endonuclease [Bacteroidales bacterium]
MATTVPESVKREQYILRSTFFYQRLANDGFFGLFKEIQKLDTIEGDRLDWTERGEWGISDEAWAQVIDSGLHPMLLFAHPKIVRLFPTFVKYYRCVAMLPLKGFSAITHISGIERIENGKIPSGELDSERVFKLISVLNEFVSLIVNISSGIDKNEVNGMMFATAGAFIDGSWRNQIGSEGERVIRTIILKELLRNDEITSIVTRDNKVLSIAEMDIAKVTNDISIVKTINLPNGYSILFSSEPDVSMYDAKGDVVGVIEIKSGLDPAGALERLGAMFKSFENTLAEFPGAVTILVISCITDEVRKRLDASLVVRQRYLTSDITADDSGKRRFVNSMRSIMKLDNRISPR